jgi:hypothetical protein
MRIPASKGMCGMRGWRIRQSIKCQTIRRSVRIGFRHHEHGAMEAALRITIVQGQKPNLFLRKCAEKRAAAIGNGDADDFLLAII